MAMPEPKDYRHLIDDPDLTDEQKDELILMVWDLMAQLVDMVYEDHPLQVCQKKSRENNRLINDLPGNPGYN